MCISDWSSDVCSSDLLHNLTSSKSPASPSKVANQGNNRRWRRVDRSSPLRCRKETIMRERVVGLASALTLLAGAAIAQETPTTTTPGMPGAAEEAPAASGQDMAPPAAGRSEAHTSE